MNIILKIENLLDEWVTVIYKSKNCLQWIVNNIENISHEHYDGIFIEIWDAKKYDLAEDMLQKTTNVRNKNGLITSLTSFADENS